MENKSQKIAIIGVGAVGATTAYALTLQNLASEIILIDINKDKQDGEVMDINDVLSFAGTGKVVGGDFKDAAESDIIIITSGAPQKPGETRMDLTAKNKEIIKSVFQQIGTINKNAIIIMVANPLDVLTHLAQEISGLPKNQVFGTGTNLDSARLRTAIARKLNINSESVVGYILGEHGDSEFVAWSTVTVGGIPVKEKITNEEELKEIEAIVKWEAYNIISKKGATYYGIATVIADMVRAVFLDQNRVLPISTHVENWNGVSGVCLGVPAVIGRTGVQSLWTIELNEEEKQKLKLSADTIKQYI